MRALLSAFVTVAVALPLVAAPQAERWRGAIDLSSVGGGQLEFFVEFTAAGDGFAATLTIPAQNATALPLRDVVYGPERIEFTLATQPVNGLFRAARDGDTATGTLQQGREFPIEMRRMAAGESVGPPRPQLPTPPFPYESIEVEYDNEFDGAHLAGTLTVPAGEGPHPAAVLITGSGAQDRDETIFGHKPFLVIADHLSRRGIAVLRVDDRGVGGSRAGSAPATSATFATDVAAGVAFLRTRREIDAERIGLIGHSEGGLIAPMVAAEDPRIAWIVLLAGTGVSGRDIMGPQLAAGQRAIGRPEENIERQLRAQARLMDAAIAGAPREEIQAAAAELVDIQLENVPEGQRRGAGRDAAVAGAVAQMTSDWFVWFLTADPADALRRVRCPVLALNGSLDLQVIAADNLPAIAAALEAGGNEDHETVELPGLNHLFQPAATGSVIEYGQIETTFAPEALEMMTEWIRSRAGLEKN